jgi:hypothetical protein
LLEMLLATAGPMTVSFGPAPTQPTTAPTVTGSEPPNAHELRDEGFRAFGRGEYRTALERFDSAKAIDPKGDEDAAVLSFRKAAIAALVADSGR